MACKEKEVKKLDGLKLPITIYSNQVHVITLYVNTAKIHKDSTDKYSNFQQSKGILNKDYTTIVKKGDIVIWKGVSSNDPLDVVNITQINYHGGVNLFGRNVLKGNDDDPAAVVGIIKRGPSEEGEDKYIEEKYVLKFTVMNNGVRRPGLFKIDPVLKAY